MQTQPDRPAILVVEDEDAVRFVLTEILEGEGYAVMTADCGPAALEQFGRNSDIDLLITDVVMPAMSGPELVAAIRQARPDLSVLYLSGYGHEQAADTIGGPGVRYVDKPFNIDELLDVVRNLLNAPQ